MSDLQLMSRIVLFESDCCVVHDMIQSSAHDHCVTTVHIIIIISYIIKLVAIPLIVSL